MEFFRAMPADDLRKYMKDTVPGFVSTTASEKGHRIKKSKAAMLAELKSLGEAGLMKGYRNDNTTSLTSKKSFTNMSSIGRDHQYKYAKKMSDLTKQDFDSMRITNLKTLLGIPHPHMHSDYPTPDEIIGRYQIPGSSTMTRGELAELALRARDEKLASKGPFYVLSRNQKKWEPTPDPTVRWGALSKAEKQKIHNIARAELESRLPSELVDKIVPQKPRPYEIGDILWSQSNSWAQPRFYKVIGYTPKGNPRLKILSTKVTKESFDGTYKNTYLVPNVSGPQSAATFGSSTNYKKWNGQPVQTTLDFGR